APLPRAPRSRRRGDRRTGARVANAHARSTRDGAPDFQARRRCRMRFGMVHRVMTDALASLGVIALVVSGQFSRWVSAAILIGLALAVIMRESWLRHPALRHLDTGALLIVLALQITRVALGANVLDVLVEFAAALQIIRLATRKGAAHDQQVIVLALLHLIAGTVL